MIPLRTDSPLRHTPYVNWAIIAINVIVFIFTMANPHAIEPYLLDPREPRVYQFFTYAFLHGGWMHIAGNMLFLYVFGNNVNDRLGHLGYLAFYLAGGVFAGLAYVITETHDAPMLGASGAISAVTGAFLVLLPRSNITVLFFYFIISVFEIPSLWFILAMFLYNDVFMAARGDAVAHSAHLGGALYGITVCMALLALHLLPRDQFDVVALIQRWNKRRQYRDMVSKGYNPFEYTQGGKGARAGPTGPPNPMIQRALDLRSSIADALSAHDLERASALYLELKSIDGNQVLSRQNQLDIANHLTAQQNYAQAADAYEGFLRTYPKYEQTEQVELMLGIIYARYLNQPDRARDCLTRAMARLHGERELSMAREELSRLGVVATPPVPK